MHTHSSYAVRRGVLHEPDILLICALAALLLFGLVILTSASAPVGYERFGDSYFFIKRQLLFGVLPGITLFFFFAKVPYHRILSLSPIAFYGAIGLLVLVFIPGIGSALNTGAKSWLVIGPQSVQPAEFMKLALIVFLVAYMSSGRVDLATPAGFFAALGLGAVPLALILLQPDIGTALVIFCIIFGMLFLGGARFSSLSLLALSGIVAFAILIAVAPYRAARFTTFLHPELDPQGIGYHINQAYMAIGSGGFWGLGLGHSRQKFQYLPEVHGDSIFAIIAEEMGLLFAAGFVILLCVIVYRMVRIARFSEADEGRLLVGGIALWFITQSFFNIGAMVGILPITGLPLPFVSHGGTALLVLLAGLGMVVNVSKHTTV